EAAPQADEGEQPDLDRWALSRTAATAELVAGRLEAYDATSAGRAIALLVDELSNWYVRRSRRRFWEGDPAAFATLRSCLLAVVVASGREREAIERLADVVREELNVRRMRFVAAADELGSYEVKPNYRRLGPLFGKDMPRVADAIATLDPARVVAAVRDGGEIGIAVGGREHTLSAEDVTLTMRAPDGYSVEREGSHAVALDLSLDDDLRREGRAREIVHAVQNARK